MRKIYITVNRENKKINFTSLNLAYEIIVINDGSTDNTKEILSKIDGIKVIDQINSGKGKAVQKGIKDSKADLIFIQDVDLYMILMIIIVY